MLFNVEKCVHVEDGNTFKTHLGHWICLARVKTPKKDELGYETAKNLLTEKITDKYLSYDEVRFSGDYMIAEVWYSGENINDYMIRQGYGE